MNDRTALLMFLSGAARSSDAWLAGGIRGVTVLARGLFVAILALTLNVVASGTHAGDRDDRGVDYYSQLSCDQLWYERNAIYARHGYCFEQPRAVATFGAGCKPPYGKLPANLVTVVRNIQSWERTRGCD